MADLHLREDLAQRLRDIARRENLGLDEVVESLLVHYDAAEIHESRQIDTLRQDRLRVYDRARRYWQSVNDARQYMSDKELDEQFWAIDPNGIPRLKHEQDTVQLPPNPWLEIIDMVDADTSVEWRGNTDTSENTKHILNTEYTDYLLARSDRSAVNDEQ